MRRFILLLSVTVTSYIQAREIPIEARVSAFFHSSKRFRDLYGDVGPSYSLEGATSIHKTLWVWADLDWFYAHRSHEPVYTQSIDYDEVTKSTVDIVNLSFGLKYVYTASAHWKLYGGLGPVVGKIFLKNISLSYEDRVNKYIAGGVAKIGAHYTFSGGVFLDLFVDYLYQPVRFHTTVDVGGLKTGLGLGYNF